MCHIPTAPHRRPPERRRIFSRSCCGRPGEPLNKVAGVEQHHHYQQQQHQQHCYHRFYMVLWSYVIRTMATTMSIKHMIDIDIDRSDHGSTKWDVYTILYIYIYELSHWEMGCCSCCKLWIFWTVTFAAAFPFKLSACLRESKPFLSVGLPLGSCLKCLSQIGLHSVCATHRSLDAATDCRIRCATPSTPMHL